MDRKQIEFGEKIIAFINAQLLTEQWANDFVGLTKPQANFQLTALLGRVIGKIEKELYGQKS